MRSAQSQESARLFKLRTGSAGGWTIRRYVE